MEDTISRQLFVMHCAILYHLYNLKNVKNTHGGVLILVKLQATKINTPPWAFFTFLNCTNGIKSRKAPHFRNKTLSQMFDRVLNTPPMSIRPLTLLIRLALITQLFFFMESKGLSPNFVSITVLSFLS